MRAIDVSSAQPKNLTVIIQQYKPEQVVVKLYLPWEIIPQSYSKAQIASARANGCPVGGYVWCYHDADPVATVNSALDLAEEAELKLSILWLDCETYEIGGVVADPGPDVGWLQAAFAACQFRGVQPGVYSGNWWLTDYLKDPDILAGIPLWLAEYNDVPDLESVHLLSGLVAEQLCGHQYSAQEIDLDVFRR